MDKEQVKQNLLEDIRSLIQKAYFEGYRQAPGTRSEHYDNGNQQAKAHATSKLNDIKEKINTFADDVCSSAGGALPYKATSKRVVYKNTKRVVYKGVRGGSYIKVNGKFVNIRNLKL